MNRNAYLAIAREAIIRAQLSSEDLDGKISDLMTSDQVTDFAEWAYYWFQTSEEEHSVSNAKISMEAYEKL